MMNGAKKSDSSIVPAKLANKAERSAAESVEGDDGTKRNAELQSTVRTQSREALCRSGHRMVLSRQATALVGTRRSRLREYDRARKGRFVRHGSSIRHPQAGNGQR